MNACPSLLDFTGVGGVPGRERSSVRWVYRVGGWPGPVCGHRILRNQSERTNGHSLEPSCDTCYNLRIGHRPRSVPEDIVKQVAPLVLASSFLLFPPASAQTTLSLMGGINFTSVDSENVPLPPNYDSAKRLFTGVAATVPIAGSFRVRLGASLSQKGNFYGVDWLIPVDSSYTNFRWEPADDLHLKMGYVEFTALASLASPVSGGPVTVQVLAGPAIGLLASCKTTWTEYAEGRPSTTTTVSCPDEAQIATLDLGLAAGAGLNVELTDRLGVAADLLYTHGLRDAGDVWVGSDPEDDRRLDFDFWAQHRTMTLSAGLTYSIR